MRITSPITIPAEIPAAHAPAAVAAGAGARVWLVRHAQVHAQWQGRAYGNYDIALSAQGEAETRALSSAFEGERIAHVVSSHLARALHMGRGIAAATGAPLALDERLREIWRGAWQGLAAAEFRARWERDQAAFLADPWHWKGHGGDSDADVCARAWPVLASAALAAHAGDAVLTTHFNVIRVLVTRALGWNPSQSFAFKNDPARASLLVDSPRGWELAIVNTESPRSAGTFASGA